MMIRARDLGIPFGGLPGKWNAITDVAGVEVGYTTLINGEGNLVVGKGPVRTGVTAILPRGKTFDPVFGGWFTLNGNGEMTGTTWVEESGFLESPIILTNTHSVGVAHDAVIAWCGKRGFFDPVAPDVFWSLPVVAETSDICMNDMNGFHVNAEHVFAALDGAASGAVDEGNVGGGTGMICHEFKGGSGTASRLVTINGTVYTVGALVQANHGWRKELTIAGVPVGQEFSELLPEFHNPCPPPGSGSIIIVIATDAPLLPHQVKKLAKRAPLGIARLGAVGNNTSGDIFFAFSTANPGAAGREATVRLDMLPNDLLSPIFTATVQACEEAVVNALVAAHTMSGINGNTAYALPHDSLQKILKKYNRLLE
jgi:D-aminopeptidase